MYYIGENELLMQKAKEGKINGVSIMGRVEDVVDEPLSKWETMIKAIHDKIFGKEENKNKSEDDMTKEELQAMTDEQLAELGLMRKSQDGNTDGNTDGQTDQTGSTDGSTVETVEKSAHEEIIKERDTLKAEIETMKAEVERLKKDNAILEKAKGVNPVADEKQIGETMDIPFEVWKKMTWDQQYNHSVLNPKQSQEYYARS